MEEKEAETYTQPECITLFAALFPNGFAGPDVLAEIAPEGQKMQAELRKVQRQAIEEAKDQPPPTIVLACQNVYGTPPHGWPPWLFNERD